MVDLLAWIAEYDISLMDFLMLPGPEQAGDPLLEEQQGGKPPVKDPTSPPDVLPILPLRGVVVYPQTAVPLTVGQPRSIKLVDDAVASDKLVGLVAAINPELETPGPTDLYRVGTIAIVHRLC